MVEQPSNDDMDGGREHPPGPGAGLTRYTCFLSGEGGAWSGFEIIYAADDAKALDGAIAISGGRSFELWQDFRLVHWFLST